MYFLVSLIVISVFLFGAVFAVSFVGGPPWSKSRELSPVKVSGHFLPIEVVSIGLTLLILGTVWTTAWFYFLFSGWSSFLYQSPGIIVHAGVQLMTAASFFVAAIGILRAWPKWRGVYLFNVFFLLASTSISMLIYGPRGHGNVAVMTGIGIVSFVIGGYLTFALYVLNQALERENKAH